MGSKSLKRFFSLCLSCLLLLSTLTLSSFAQVTLINSNMTSSTWSWSSYSSTPVLTYDSSNDRNKFEMTASTPLSVRLTSIATDKVYLNHSYKIHFEIWGHFEDYEFSVVLITKENLSTESSHILITINDNLATSDNSYADVNIDFSPSYYVGSVTDIKLDFVFNRVNGATNVRNLYIKNLSMVDSDDNSSFWTRLYSWLNSIITKLQTVGESIVNGISSAISSLGNSISGFFVSLGEGIEEGFDTIRDWILYFRHPVDLDENGVPVDENGIPIYENIFDIPDFFETIEDWIDTLDESKSTVNSNVTAGIEKIGLVTGYLNTMTAIPIISILVSFGLAVIVIKKVLG